MHVDSGIFICIHKEGLDKLGLGGGMGLQLHVQARLQSGDWADINVIKEKRKQRPRRDKQRGRRLELVAKSRTPF